MQCLLCAQDTGEIVSVLCPSHHVMHTPCFARFIQQGGFSCPKCFQDPPASVRGKMILNWGQNSRLDEYIARFDRNRYNDKKQMEEVDESLLLDPGESIAVTLMGGVSPEKSIAIQSKDVEKMFRAHIDVNTMVDMGVTVAMMIESGITVGHISPPTYYLHDFAEKMDLKWEHLMKMGMTMMHFRQHANDSFKATELKIAFNLTPGEMFNTVCEGSMQALLTVGWSPRSYGEDFDLTADFILAHCQEPVVLASPGWTYQGFGLRDSRCLRQLKSLLKR